MEMVVVVGWGTVVARLESVTELGRGVDSAVGRYRLLKCVPGRTRGKESY